MKLKNYCDIRTRHYCTHIGFIIFTQLFSTFSTDFLVTYLTLVYLDVNYI